MAQPSERPTVPPSPREQAAVAEYEALVRNVGHFQASLALIEFEIERRKRCE